MQNLNYWKQFESTGKVEDYLSYRSCLPCVEEQQCAAVVQEGSPMKDENAGQMYAAGQLGENSYAGIHMCDRNDIEANAYRGI